MTYQFSKKSIQKLSGVHPDLIRVCMLAITLTSIDFGIVQGVRTLEKQKELYGQGRTAPGPIVTWTLKSRHLPQADGYGHAIDFGVYLNGVYINGDTPDEQRHYETVVPFFKVAAQKLGIKIVCGADWPKNKRDVPHIELDRAHYG